MFMSSLTLRNDCILLLKPYYTVIHITEQVTQGIVWETVPTPQPTFWIKCYIPPGRFPLYPLFLFFNEALKNSDLCNVTRIYKNPGAK